MDINIRIDQPEKLSFLTTRKSIFISFDYNAEIIGYIKSFSNRNYNPKTREWELPILYLNKFVNTFSDANIQMIDNTEGLEVELEEHIPKDYTFKTSPFRHQINGVEFGMNVKKFILGDEQGLGKSKQVIDLANILIQQKKIKRCLIICGVNSLKYNWQNEVSTHSDLKPYVLGTRVRKKSGKSYEGSGKDKLDDLVNLPSNDCNVIITNVETLRLMYSKISKYKYSFPIADEINKLVRNDEIGFIAFDESHKCKDTTSLQGRAIMKIHAPYMCSMSGTPLMNNAIDLYFPLKWLGYENHSLFEFKQHYCILGGINNAEILGYKNLKEIKQALSLIMIRRLKSEVLDLPEKIHQDEYVDLTKEQVKVYEQVLNKVRSELHKVKFMQNPLSILVRLRQITGNPEIVSDVVKESSKLNRMKELVDEVVQNGGKVVIFSNWVQVISKAKQMLDKYNPAYIAGETGNEDRMLEVSKFQNDDTCKVILGTIGAMGTGLTLTAGQTVIFLDEPWTRAFKDQAEDRVHRIGTKGTVNIITLICKGTIDERIHDIVYRKGLLADQLIDGKSTVKVDLNLINRLIE